MPPIPFNNKTAGEWLRNGMGRSFLYGDNSQNSAPPRATAPTLANSASRAVINTGLPSRGGAKKFLERLAKIWQIPDWQLLHQFMVVAQC